MIQIKNKDISYLNFIQNFISIRTNTYILKNEMLKNTKDNMKILHPLPRVNEIDTDVDKNEKAYYFQQALNGVYTRQAIIAAILGLKPEND